MTEDRRFLSHAYLEPKVERDQDGLHLIIPYRNKTSLGLVFSPTVRLDSQYLFSFANLFLVEKIQRGKIEGEREVQQACCCCVCEKICTTSPVDASTKQQRSLGSRLYRCAPHSIH